MLPPGSLVENQSFWVKNIHFRLIEPIMNQFHVFEKKLNVTNNGYGQNGLLPAKYIQIELYMGRL